MVRVYRSDLEGFYEVSEERAKELEQVGYSRNPNVAPNAVIWMKLVKIES